MANAKEIHALVFLAHPEDVSMVSVLKIHARTLTVHLVYALQVDALLILVMG